MKLVLQSMLKALLVLVAFGLIGLTVALWQEAAVVFWGVLTLLAMPTLFFWMDAEYQASHRRRSSNLPKPRPEPMSVPPENSRIVK